MSEKGLLDIAGANACAYLSGISLGRCRVGGCSRNVVGVRVGSGLEVLGCRVYGFRVWGLGCRGLMFRWLFGFQSPRS